MTDHCYFSRVCSTDPSADIVQQVRNNIINGKLSVGDRLPSERVLAEQFGVSRNTLRKAINSLVQLGLVIVKKGSTGGAFISQEGGSTISTAIQDMYSFGNISIEELTEARKILTTAVVRQACERCTAEDIQALEENVRKVKKALEQQDIEERTSLNINFYQLLGRAAKNQVLTILMDAVGKVIVHFAYSTGLAEPAFFLPVRYKIIECLYSRDAVAAEEAIAQHLNELEEHYKNMRVKSIDSTKS